MTQATKRAPRRAAIPAAAFAALLLAGCSTGHIGESWQCPLAEGGTCDSVAAADPAVPDPKAAGATVLTEPLWRVRDAGSSVPVETTCAADCGEGFDLFGWIARLFGGDNDGGEGQAGPVAVEPKPALAETSPEPPASPLALARTEPKVADPATALFPADSGPAEDDPDAGDLRTDEVVARIWIAPFVDADGVYREGSYIRVVLAPAGWRLR